MKNFLKVGNAYTYEEIHNMDLDDILQIRCGNTFSPVQTAHISYEDVIKRVPKIAKTLYKYVCTTHEEISVFRWSENNTISIEEVFDIEPRLDFLPPRSSRCRMNIG